MNKTLALAGVAIMLISGAAYAEDKMLENKTVMGTFYTDDTMTTMKTGDDFTTAWMAMQAADREGIKAECVNPIDSQEEFCKVVGVQKP